MLTSPEAVAPASAAVSIEDFEGQVELHIGGVTQVLALIRRHQAYIVKGIKPRKNRSVYAGALHHRHRSRQREGSVAGDLGMPPEMSAAAFSCTFEPKYVSGGAATSPGTPPAVMQAQDGLMTPEVDAQPHLLSPSRGNFVLIDEPSSDAPLAAHSDADWIVPLTLFDRFVRCCAEPSAQAAWQLQARFAVRAAAEAAFNEIRTSGMDQRALSDLLLTGRVAASVAFAAAAALLPFATAVVASAFSAYAHGGCAGAWSGLLPRAEAESVLRAQALREGGPGQFLVRLSSSHPFAVVISYTAHALVHSSGGAAGSISPDGDIRVIHEILQLPLPGGGITLRGVTYPNLAQAVCASRTFLKSPCLAASLAVVGWAMPTRPSVPTTVAEATGPCPNALGSFSGLLEPAVLEASIVQELLKSGGEAMTHVGAGLPHLSYALYGSDVAKPTTEPLVQLLRYCDEQQQEGRFVFPTLSFERMRDAAAHAVLVSHVLPGVTSPAALAATAWTGPLPVPSPDVLPAAAQFSSSSSSKKNTLRCFALSGFHAALVYEQTRARLDKKPPGSYLLRASQSQQNSIVLAFVDSDWKVRQSLISPKIGALSAHAGEVVCSGKTYKSLRDVVLAHSAQSADGTSAVLRAAIPPASDLITLDLVSVAADATVFSSIRWFERVAAP